MRGALATTVVVTAVIASAPSALADPPSNASQALQQLDVLSHQAEVLTQDYKKAQDDEAAKKTELNQANADEARAQHSAEQAQTAQQQYQGQVDSLTKASYQGARLTTLSALLSSQSPAGFLDRASMLAELARSSDETISRFQSAADQAQAAEKESQNARARAVQAEAASARILGEISVKKAAMQAEVAKAQQQYDSLNTAEKAVLAGPHITVGLLGGSGVAINAVNAALSRQGDPYVWGATGPNQFDCSGLVQWAYKQAGVSLPRSTYSQVTVGTSVSENDLKPGDLLFFYSDYSHVGMYIGNGNMVHAPTTGQTVQVVPYKYVGQPTAIRRIAG